MVTFNVRATPSGPRSLETRYLYGADGSRVKKWVRTGAAGSGESTVYINGLFEHYRDNRQGGISNTRLHLLDGQRRVAILRRGPPTPTTRGRRRSIT
jgi:hypothetical protein